MRWNGDDCDVSIMKNRVVKEIIKKGDEELKFIMSDGDEYVMYHEQECRESVTIEDICGDLDDLLGVTLLMSEEARGETKSPEKAKGEDYGHEDSETWTFYKFRTIKGDVTIRWYGSSNGYYSEWVDFKKVKQYDSE